MLFNGSLMKFGSPSFPLPSYFLTSFLSHSRRFLTEISSPHCFPLSAVSPFHMAVCPRYVIANTFQLSPEKTLALILRAQPDTTPSLENLSLVLQLLAFPHEPPRAFRLKANPLDGTPLLVLWALSGPGSIHWRPSAYKSLGAV